ncbi:hypothetical protein GGS23DRAFT_74836 [Durotheca rogersii]|uniref:uncharacterized protein n=1 Tax=Durotheca rogersii TaxID=419775 RepID=UPI00221E93B3|nr:uncharacterized protein GGS23DRAFT_74836 [Durotheca rogersii]KAI5862909.1 hypothetical protein GGS23DRAFT_74836 [Durotheca rogersii]
MHAYIRTLSFLFSPFLSFFFLFSFLFDTTPVPPSPPNPQPCLPSLSRSVDTLRQRQPRELPGVSGRTRRERVLCGCVDESEQKKNLKTKKKKQEENDEEDWIDTWDRPPASSLSRPPSRANHVRAYRTYHTIRTPSFPPPSGGYL